MSLRRPCSFPPNSKKGVYYYTVTNVVRGEVDGPNGFWDTEELLRESQNPDGAGPRFPNGLYTVVVYGVDHFGAEIVVRRPVFVQNP